MTSMMDLIDGDVAKYIWGFFIEFDESDPSNTVKTSSIVAPLDRRVDFQSIQSLRCVNKIFFRAFEEISGWSRCALAIKREYRTLKNDEKFFDNWSFVFRLQTLRANHLPSMQDSNATRNHWASREERRQVGKFVSRAMERKKVSVYRCNQLIQMLDRGPFTQDEKLLIDKVVFAVQ